MKLSKLALSPAEWQLAANTDFILTKNRIIDAVCQMFGGLTENYRQIISAQNFPFPETLQLHPKISKGEKYEQLPWVMLDYPRYFSKENDHFAIRSFFWWGNYFSIQLHASGRYLHLMKLEPLLQQKGWFTGVTDDAWNHKLPNNQWVDVSNWQKMQVPEKEWYFKAAKKIPIDRWADAPAFLNNAFGEIITAISK